MMRNETDYLLSDLLVEWHRWANKHQYASQPKTSAMFSEVSSPRQWDDTGEIADETQHKTTMKAMEFAINGGRAREGAMPEPHRTAIEVEARNLRTGAKVWSNPRLPADRDERAVLLIEARNMLMIRLWRGGVM